MNIGDVITTAEQIEALPAGAMLLGRYDDEAPWITTANGTRWDLIEYAAPLTVIYLPGQRPRPERVVKAEALREVGEWARTRDYPGFARACGILADHIEAGDAL